MARPDGRKFDQLREVRITYEGLDRVDGSARFAFGTTVSLVSVSGPIEVRLASELPSQATLDVHIRPLAGLPGTDSKTLSSIIKTVLTPALLLSHNPRTLVQIVGQALCGNETGSGTGSAGRGWNASLIASLVNATTAALLNASSVPMKGVVCAVAIGRVSDPSSSQTTLVLDPSEAELPRLSGSGCFAFMFSSTLAHSKGAHGSDIPPMSLIWTNYSSTGGPFSESEYAKAQQMAESGATEVWLKLKESIENIGQRPSVKREQIVKVENSQVHEESMEI